MDLKGVFVQRPRDSDEPPPSASGGDGATLLPILEAYFMKKYETAIFIARPNTQPMPSIVLGV